MTLQGPRDKPKNGRWKLRGGLLAAFLFVTLAAIFIITIILEVPSAPSYPVNPKVVFEPIRADSQYTMPVIVTDTGMWIAASFGKKYVWTLLDSGSVDAFCPANVAGPGRQIGISQPFNQVPMPTTARGIILPHVRLRACDLQDFWLAVYDVKASKAYSYNESMIPLSVFKDMVVIIDYRRSVIIVRQPEVYEAGNINESSPSKQTWLPLIPIYSGDYGPYPVVQGTIDGIKANFVLDTGSTGGIWVTNRKLFPRFSAIKPYTAHNDFTTALQKRGHPVCHWSAGPLQGTAPIVLFAKDASLDIDASLGNAVLQNYRITIDYPGKRVGFETYPPAK